VLAIPATAIADTSSLDAYGGIGGVTQTAITKDKAKDPQKTSAAPAVQTVGTGSLPFTGFDVLAVAAAGGLLAGLGFSLRRLSARRWTA
jgi:hypothetical protein